MNDKDKNPLINDPLVIASAIRAAGEVMAAKESKVTNYMGYGGGDVGAFALQILKEIDRG